MASRAKRLDRLQRHYVEAILGDTTVPTRHLFGLVSKNDRRRLQITAHIQQTPSQTLLVLPEAIKDFCQLIPDTPREEEGNQSRLPPWPTGL